MSEIDNKLSKRVSSLIAFGAMPSGFIALLGDFFTPKGGAVAVGCLGVVVMVILIYLIAYLSASDGTGKKPWWFELTSKDKDINWIWIPKSPFFSHGVHVLIIFVVICFFSAFKSLASASSMGYLAKNSDSIKLAQQQLGLSKEILDEVRKVGNEVVILNGKAENFKKEQSDDPRKELVNLGISWDEVGLEKAVENQDIKAINLFALTNFKPKKRNGVIIGKAIESKNDDLIDALQKIDLSAKYLQHFGEDSFFYEERGKEKIRPYGCEYVVYSTSKLDFNITDKALRIIKKSCREDLVSDEKKEAFLKIKQHYVETRQTYWIKWYEDVEKFISLIK